jgi:hypothetical protein
MPLRVGIMARAKQPVDFFFPSLGERGAAAEE